MCLVVFLKGTQAHDAFALHLHQPFVRDLPRNAVNRLRLFRDGFADAAVAPCRRLHEFAPVVGQVQRQPVKFVFNVVKQIAPPRQLLRPRDPGVQLLQALHLVHRPQPIDMPVFRKALQRRAADFPCRAAFQHLAGFGFQRPQFVVKPVPLHVAHVRVVQHVV